MDDPELDQQQVNLAALNNFIITNVNPYLENFRGLYISIKSIYFHLFLYFIITNIFNLLFFLINIIYNNGCTIPRSGLCR